MRSRGRGAQTHWALWETRDAWRRAYEGRLTQEERAAALLAQLVFAQTGLVGSDHVQGAIADVAGALAA
jgi:hypothetical protein